MSILIKPMDRDTVIDALFKMQQQAELDFLTNTTILDVYLDFKEIENVLKSLIDEIKDEVMEYIDENHGDDEFEYKNKTIKIVHKAGLLNYENVPAVGELKARLKYQQEVYKNFLLQVERGKAKFEDGHLLTADGEMIPKEQLPTRKEATRYVRVGKSI